MASTPDAEPWWKEHPGQLADVLARIRQRGWTIAELRFNEAREEVTLDVGGLPGPPSALTVTLPPGYPTVPAPIKGPDGLDEHIHPADGTLCLPMQLTDAVDLIDAALHLYEVAKNGPNALRALGAGSAEPRPGFLGAPARRAVSLATPLPAGTWGTFSFYGTATPDLLRGVITRTWDADNDERSAASPTLLKNLVGASGADAKRHEFPWWRTDERRFPTAHAELVEFWGRGLPESARKWVANYERLRGPKGGRSNRAVRLYGLIVPEEGPKHDEWHERVVVILRRGDKFAAFPVPSFDELGTRVPGADVLRDRTVAVAGIGMLGGNLAIDLARTGVGALRFADYETVELGNLVRQPYDVSDVGERKVDALRRHIQRAAPTCDVPEEHLLASRVARYATRAEAKEWLAGADLLIMTTGDHQAELHLSEIARELEVPIVSGWVSLGVWGALALTTKWGETGCRWCLDQRHDELAQLSEPPGAEDLYAPGCGYPTFPGNLIDGRVASSIIGQMAIDTLLGQPSAGPLAVMTLRTPAGRVGPSTTFHDLSPDANCPICAR
ncbi:MAG: hypothetical protein JWN67_2941 [Actinomycetia bacterium]|nr:hypothetical protein [Actinomycetes bacterium]